MAALALAAFCYVIALEISRYRKQGDVTRFPCSSAVPLLSGHLGVWDGLGDGLLINTPAIVSA